LVSVIKDAKKCYCNGQIENSTHKIKTVWNITKFLTGTKVKSKVIKQLNIGGYNL
jgi:hypothetical protein